MKITDLVVVLRFSIGCWGASKIDRGTTQEVITNKHADAKAGKFVKNLLGGTCEELKAIINEAQCTRNEIGNCTLPYATGARLVPVMELNDVMDRMQARKNKFDQLLNDFLEAYPTIVEEAERKSKDLWQDGQCPSVDEVRNKFSFDINIQPLPESNNFDSKLGISELENELKQSYEKQLEKTMEHAEKHLISKIYERASTQRDSLANYDGKRGQLRQDSIDNTLDIMDSVNKLNVRQNTHITDWCRRVKNCLGEHADVLRNDPTARNDAITELGKVMREISGEPSQPVTVTNNTSDENDGAPKQYSDLGDYFKSLT